MSHGSLLVRYPWHVLRGEGPGAGAGLTLLHLSWLGNILVPPPGGVEEVAGVREVFSAQTGAPTT